MPVDMKYTEQQVKMVNIQKQKQLRNQVLYLAQIVI